MNENGGFRGLEHTMMERGEGRSVGLPADEKAEGSCIDAVSTSSNAIFQATMTVTVMVFLYEGAAYNMIFLSRVLPALGKDSLVLPFAILFNSVWILALASYLRAYLADPGVVPKEWHDFVHEVGPALPVVPSSARYSPGKATYCRKCSIPRPERAHHCNVTGVCVLRMDHYCPWINNCVGFKNYKFFILLVIYGSLASLVGIATTIPELILCIGVLLGADEGNVWKVYILQTSDILAFLMFGSLAVFLAVLLAPMLFTHLPLAAGNATAIEANYENIDNPYHLSSRLANLEQIFGRLGPDWFIPVKPFRPKCDGVSFPRIDEPLGKDKMPIADEEILEGQQLWRVRYKVRSAREAYEDEFDPLKTLSNWWRGVPDDDFSHPPAHGLGCP